MDTALTSSLIIVAAGLLAGGIPLLFEWSHRQAHQWIAFGAGVILGAAFIHMIPEALELAGIRNLAWLLGGFLLLYGIEQLTMSHHHSHDEESGAFHELGLLTFIGIAVHDLVDGIALGSGHHVPELTPALFAALVLHKVPMAFSLTVLLWHGGYRKGRIMLMLLGALLMIPLGVLIFDPVMHRLGEDHSVAVGRLILFSAGTFIYISVYELLPEMHRLSNEHAKIGRFFLVGLFSMFLLNLLHPVV